MKERQGVHKKVQQCPSLRDFPNCSATVSDSPGQLCLRLPASLAITKCVRREEKRGVGENGLGHNLPFLRVHNVNSSTRSGGSPPYLDISTFSPL